MKVIPVLFLGSIAQLYLLFFVLDFTHKKTVFKCIILCSIYSTTCSLFAASALPVTSLLPLKTLSIIQKLRKFVVHCRFIANLGRLTGSVISLYKRRHKALRAVIIFLNLPIETLINNYLKYPALQFPGNLKTFLQSAIMFLTGLLQETILTI